MFNKWGEEMKDTIYRKDAIKSIEEMLILDDRRHLNDLEFGHNAGLNHAVSVLEDLPSTDRPQGEWIYCEDYVGHDGYECSNCGFFVPWAYDCYADSNFILNYHTCPHCDARMKGADDE